MFMGDGELGVAGPTLLAPTPKGCFSSACPTAASSGQASTHWWDLWLQRQAPWDPRLLCCSTCIHTQLMECCTHHGGFWLPGQSDIFFA